MMTNYKLYFTDILAENIVTEAFGQNIPNFHPKISSIESLLEPEELVETEADTKKFMTTMFGAPVKNLSPEELSDYLAKQQYDTSDINKLKKLKSTLVNKLKSATDEDKPELQKQLDTVVNTLNKIDQHKKAISGKSEPEDIEFEKSRAFPYIHAGMAKQLKIVDDSGKEIFDIEGFKKILTKRPTQILKQNTKMAKSGGNVVFYDISLPAFRGLVVDESTGEFKIVNTCPGAGTCKIYCYARKGGYVQWIASSLSSTQMLNFLLNDWQGFKTMLLKEIKAISARTQKRNLAEYKMEPSDVPHVYNIVQKSTNNTVSTIKANTLDEANAYFILWANKFIIRWHDAGDFMSPDYLGLAYDIAHASPNVLHYAYTKMINLASSLPNKPKNFIFNFSYDAIPSEKAAIDVQKNKISITVPSPLFKNHMHPEISTQVTKSGKEKINKKYVFNSPQDELAVKQKMANKYNIPLESIITYDEMIKLPENPDAPQKYNVIVYPGHGDDAATRRDVHGTYLFIH